MIPITFFGSTPYSLRVLEALKQDGRYKITDDSPIVGVVVDYGRLITKEEINRFPFGIINLHPSLLPKHRGAIPAVSAILAGDKVTGVTIIKINEKFDQGEILAQETEPVLEDDTPPILYDRLFAKGISLLLRVLPEYLAGNVTLKPQGPAVGPYEKRLTKASGRIDWTKDDKYLERFIRAMQPWPGAYTTVSAVVERFIAHQKNRSQDLRAINGSTTRIVKILKAHLNEHSHLQIDQLQIEGKNPMGWKEFENGYLK